MLFRFIWITYLCIGGCYGVVMWSGGCLWGDRNTHSLLMLHSTLHYFISVHTIRYTFIAVTKIYVIIYDFKSQIIDVLNKQKIILLFKARVKWNSMLFIYFLNNHIIYTMWHWTILRKTRKTKKYFQTLFS